MLIFLFRSNSGENGNADLQNIEVASDRGYMTPSLVFLYLLACGAMVIGTVKRALCWPYTYSQKTTESDKRTKIEPKGSPSLFLKSVKSAGRKVTASAFRNGSDSVSTTISSLHRGFHWEGIALDWKDYKEYSSNPTSMRDKIFPYLVTRNMQHEERDDE